MSVQITLRVNNKDYTLPVENNWTLLETLREGLNLTGTKQGCGEGECGACTVILDGAPVNACLVLAVDAAGGEIQTIEGLAGDSRLSRIQQAFIQRGAFQCGYCTPGVLMATKALLDQNPQPGERDIRRALDGNLCRCTGYTKIVEAIQVLAAENAKE